MSWTSAVAELGLRIDQLKKKAASNDVEIEAFKHAHYVKTVRIERVEQLIAAQSKALAQESRDLRRLFAEYLLRGAARGLQGLAAEAALPPSAARQGAEAQEAWPELRAFSQHIVCQDDVWLAGSLRTHEWFPSPAELVKDVVPVTFS